MVTHFFFLIFWQDLRDSVGEREDLIAELKRLAEPLASSCSPEVASQLNSQVEEAVKAWNDTRKNLYHIVDKYKGAVKLWKNYREARDDIRKWIDQQWNALDILEGKSEGAVLHIKVSLLFFFFVLITCIIYKPVD